MSERNREIKRRRHRRQKRSKLRRMLARATEESQRGEIQNKIIRTYPRYTREA